MSNAMLGIEIVAALCISCGTLLAGVSLGSEVPCLEIEITGAVSQSDCNGRYRFDESYGQHCSGRQAWLSYPGPGNGNVNNSTTFIYYLEDGYDGWVIAKSSCSSWGNFMAMVKTDSQTPFDVTESWIEYSDADRKFTSNAAIKVSCTKRSVDYCASATCFNGAMCVNQVEDFVCLCQDPFTGHLCDKRVGSETDDFALKWHSVKVTLTVVVIVIAVVCAVIVTYMVCRCIQQQKRRREDVAQEVRRNIFTGNDGYQYKPLVDSLIENDGDDADKRPFGDKF